MLELHELEKVCRFYIEVLFIYLVIYNFLCKLLFSATFRNIVELNHKYQSDQYTCLDRQDSLTKAGFPLANIFARSDFFLLSQPN